MTKVVGERSSIHELVAAQVARTPTAIAVSYEDQHLTFEELDRRANQLARWLVAHGVAGDSCVAVVMERSLEMVIALLAIVKAGGAYLPLDPETPPRRLSFIVADARCVAVIAQARFCDRLADVAVPVLALDTEAAQLAAHADTALDVPVAPDNLVYVIYTSGSTGQPKGVMNVHRGLVNRLLWMQDAYGLTASDRVLQKTPFTFDVSVWEFFWPLITGARLVMAQPEGHRDPRYLAATIRDAQITTIHFVPSMLRAFLDGAPVETCTSLRRVICSGEALTRDLVQAFHARVPCELHNLYGPTEASIDVSATPCRKTDRGPVSIGRAIANIQLYVLDDALAPCAPGVEGELYIAGVGLARGYLRRPDLTARTFVPDPFGAPGARMYRTGDLARLRDDGEIDYAGRIDNQLKLRGNRIELGEIESALLESSAGIRAAAVIAREDTPGDLRLVAYVTGPAIDTKALRQELRASLPEYMLPAAVVVLDTLPLTSSGKLDRRALPAPPAERPQHDRCVPPEGPIEEMLAGWFCELLKVDRVGATDDFFELGGHSLLLMQLATRIERELQIELSLAQMFDAPTVRLMSEAIVEHRAAASADETLAALAEIENLSPEEIQQLLASSATRDVPAVDRSGPLPLAFGQERIWMFEQLRPGLATYNLVMMWRLEGRLDTDVLARCFARIVERHEVLRSSYRSDGGTAHLTIHAHRPPPLSIIDLPISADPDAEAMRLAAAEAAQPFDLERDALMRTVLLRRDAESHWLVVTVHHIVFDGWSQGVLTHELAALYRAGGADPLPAPAIQYVDYAAWQRQRMHGSRALEQAEYWRGQLAGAPAALELPTDRPRPARQTFDGAFVEFEIDRELSAGLRALSRAHGTTLFVTLLSAWAAVLSRLSGQNDIVIGTAAANRYPPEVEGLIGFFINTLALRIDLSGEPSAAELIARVRKTMAAAQDHQDLPFERVVEILQPPRQLDRSPVFQAMIAWQHEETGTLDLPAIRTQRLAPPPSAVLFDIELDFSETQGRIVGQLRYAKALFDRPTIDRHCGYVVAMLRAMVAEPTKPLARVDVLGPAERELLLATWNRTAQRYPEQCVHELFEQQARDRPTALAVIDEATELTYGELDARANRLAHCLIRHGVKRGDRVATLLDRGVELVIAQLAILKAGATYVPIARELPHARQAWIVADCRARLILVGDADGADLGAETLPIGAATDALPSSSPALQLSCDAACYVMYTSGSTGTPKGVVVAHRGVIRLVCNNGFAEFLASDRIAWVGNPAFDISTLEVWAPLVHGGCLVVVSRAVVLAPQALRALVKRGLTVLHLTSGLFNQVIDDIGDTLADLRLLLVGGDVVDPTIIRHVLARYRPPYLLHCYGPTETTTFACTARVIEVDAKASRLPIGRPIANTRIYVLDAYGAPVPRGTIGELHVGGDGVAHGYLDRPALTAERFVPDPYAGGGARMYRTGDLARYLPDGNLEFLGRNDHQVKVRGFRIELQEIEAVLADHPNVREAVVIARPDPVAGNRVVGYVSRRTQGELVGSELRAFVAERLPDFMVPSAVVVLDELPLNVNGKIDRAKLPEAGPEVYDQSKYVAPRTEAEQALARIWCELLGVDRVGIHDEFFARGGNSLLTVRLRAMVRRELGADLALADLFDASTIAEQALRLNPVRDDASAVVRMGLSEGPAEVLQPYWWAVEERHPHAAIGCEVMRVHGPLDATALERAVRAIGQRHEVVRTNFTRASGELRQIVRPARAPYLPAYTYEEWEGSASSEGDLIKASRELLAPFDLTDGPLLRFKLVRLAPGEHALLMATHHIMYDGPSRALLFRDLDAAYRAAVADRSRDPVLEPLPFQFLDVAAYLHAYRESAGGRADRDYWQRRLDGVPPVELPVDFSRAAVAEAEAAALAATGKARVSHFPSALVQTHDAALGEAVAAAARRDNVSVLVYALTGLALLLHGESAQRDIVIATSLNLRPILGADPLIGGFNSPIFMRIDLSQRDTHREVLRQVRDTFAQAYTHALISPLDMVPHGARVNLGFVAELMQPPRLADLGATSVFVPVERATQFDLRPTVGIAGTRLTVTIEYNTLLFHRETAERLCTRYAAILRAIVEQPDARFS